MRNPAFRNRLRSNERVTSSSSAMMTERFLTGLVVVSMVLSTKPKVGQS
jgi:hypothetical protein